MKTRQEIADEATSLARAIGTHESPLVLRTLAHLARLIAELAVSADADHEKRRK